MKNFWRTAGALALAILIGTEAQALYRFDDLYGPSGVGTQWMVITGGRNTVGNASGSTAETQRLGALDASGDIVSGRNSVEVWNGRPFDELDEYSNRDIHTLFLVLPENQGNLTVNFSSPSFDAITPDVLLDSTAYYAQKTPQGTPLLDLAPSGKYSYTDFWKRYDFQFVKSGQQKYESVRGNFIFHQNPSSQYPSTPSQTLEVPFVIANVYNGTARDEPLLLRTTLRDNQRTGNRSDIVACDRFEWDVVNPMTAGGSQWVFVPVDTWPIDTQRIYYNLTTEVTNHTAVRYAVQRYDNYSWPHLDPAYWKFDLPRTPDIGDLANPFYLDPLSHIAPGLTTVYRQRYDVNQGEKRALRLYPVDPAAGFRELILNHRILFGIELGTVAGPTLTGSTATAYNITAFNPRTANPEAVFLEAVARQMNAYDPGLGLREILIPSATGFLSGGAVVDNEYVAGDIIRSFAVRRTIPNNLRRTGTEGLLPLHVTFNLPRTHLYVSQHWDSLLQEWYDTGDIHDLFAQNLSIYLLSRKTGEVDNPWDMLQEMIRQDAYRDQVKIFMDEDRGVITVSFIVMLMDGTRDNVRPALYLVRDQTATTNNTFMIVRDGWLDNIWDLTFYAAPAGYSENNYTQPVSGDVHPDKDGGGGCGVLSAAGMALLLVVPLICRRKR